MGTPAEIMLTLGCIRIAIQLPPAGAGGGSSGHLGTPEVSSTGEIDLILGGAGRKQGRP